MGVVKKLAGQTAIYGLGTIVPRFLNYAIMTPLFTRVFEKEQYGIVTELYAWMVLLQIILTYGMETGFFRFSQKQEDYDKVYSTTLLSLFITSLLFVVLVFIFIGPVSSFMDYRNNHDYIKMFALILATDSFCAIPFARLRRENKPVMFSIIKITNVVVTIAVVLFLLLMAPSLYEKSHGWFRKVYDPGYGVGYVFVANLAGSVVTLLMLSPLISSVKFIFDRILWKRMMRYSFPLLIAGLSGSINDALDKVILRRMTGEENGLATVGEYGAGYKVAVLMALFIQMFRFAAEPFFFERAKHHDAKETYRVVMKYFVISMLVVYLLINLYLPAIQYILGRSYRNSLIIVPIVSMAYLLYGIYVNHSIWYKLNDLTRFGAYITLAGAAITIIINIIFIPEYGYIASAWAHVASYGSMILISFFFARKYYPVDYRMILLLPYFILTIAVVIFDLRFGYENMWLRIGVNTIFILLFLGFAQYRDKIFNVFVKSSNDGNEENKTF
jgi:O-antigen/teichoic acid export membrane protein